MFLVEHGPVLPTVRVGVLAMDGMRIKA
jgi:hypothetical protein